MDVLTRHSHRFGAPRSTSGPWPRFAVFLRVFLSVFGASFYQRGAGQYFILLHAYMACDRRTFSIAQRPPYFAAQRWIADCYGRRNLGLGGS